MSKQIVVLMHAAELNYSLFKLFVLIPFVQRTIYSMFSPYNNSLHTEIHYP
jgi:hypothetical protein